MERLRRDQDRKALRLMTEDLKNGYDFDRREVDVYWLIEPILTRPVLYFGRPSITAFFHFYYGVSYFGGISHAGPSFYKLKNDLHLEGGAIEWACEKHDWTKSADIASHYLRAAREKLKADGYCVAAVSPHKVEEIGLDLFIKDLKAYRNSQKDPVCGADKCWKRLVKGESFVCSGHTGFQD